MAGWALWVVDMCKHYVKRGKKIQGPFTFFQVENLIECGKLRMNDEICIKVMGEESAWCMVTEWLTMSTRNTYKFEEKSLESPQETNQSNTKIIGLVIFCFLIFLLPIILSMLL